MRLVNEYLRLAGFLKSKAEEEATAVGRHDLLAVARMWETLAI